MGQKLIITADDFGLTRHITDTILEAADEGVLNNVSIVANGDAVEYALAEYRRRSARLNISVHLNLTEGQALAARESVSLLIGDSGVFRRSFTSLWLRYIFSSPRSRRIIRMQIRSELSAQMSKIRTILGNNAVLRADGHQHIHMLPFVADELSTVSKEYNISSVRIPTEPLFFARPIRVYFSLNIIKHILLNILGRRNLKRLRMAGIETSNHLIGVLFTGCMTESAVERGLKRVHEISRGNNSTEIIFHPGGADESERDFLMKYGASSDWHFSPWRRRERDLLKKMRYKFDKQ